VFQQSLRGFHAHYMQRRRERWRRNEAAALQDAAYSAIPPSSRRSSTFW
jgi:hypothetical protein